MTDELVKRLREHCILAGFSKKLVREATDHIEALTAERDGLLRCVTDNHVALCRAEAAEAERDGYRQALEDIIKDYEPGYPLSHDVIKYVARAALKGETP